MCRIVHKNHLYLVLPRFQSGIQRQTFQQHRQVGLRQFSAHQGAK